MKIEQPITVKVEKIIDEAKDIKTFIFKHKLEAKPGQFIMFWLPRINQKPFGVSYLKEDSFGVTVSKVGPFTEEVFKLKENSYVGIQGPYGKEFEIRGTNVVLVGGGYGTAPLAFLADELIKKNKDVTFIIGAKTKEYLVYEKRFENKKIKIMYCTDDGSYGKKGFTTDVLKDIINEKIDMIYTCGPEIMMKKVIEISDLNNIECQVSLERYMKCGFGICGQCVVDPLGIRVCKEGPVFDKEIIKKISEFGEYKRDATGKKIRL